MYVCICERGVNINCILYVYVCVVCVKTNANL